MTFVRIVLSFFGANMAMELIIVNTNRESVPVIFYIIFMGLFYYGLTLYVKNRR
jgi:hypothetical protein